MVVNYQNDQRAAYNELAQQIINYFYSEEYPIPVDVTVDAKAWREEQIALFYKGFKGDAQGIFDFVAQVVADNPEWFEVPQA
jgi:hypothetical protein